ncbi:helix-turn-helix domain-containing protein [Phenylobacterium sp.]|uniref:helix-turn-helix domain-containing protein n=1 Tax=Phenylobacterium sp. TaxID=1871053 RepID=UPI0035AFBF0C
MTEPGAGHGDPLDVALGQVIRYRRLNAKMSQSALADALALSFQQVQKYERGANRVSFSTLVRIAQALDCRLADLVGDLDRADGTPATASEASLLAEPDAFALLKVFSTIRSPKVRRAILDLARNLAPDD